MVKPRGGLWERGMGTAKSKNKEMREKGKEEPGSPQLDVAFVSCFPFSCYTRYLNGSCRVTPVKING